MKETKHSANEIYVWARFSRFYLDDVINAILEHLGMELDYQNRTVLKRKEE